MATLRDYLSKNLSSVVARSKLGLKMRPIANSLVPALGDKSLDDLTPEFLEEWGAKRLAEPKKDGTPRTPASVEQELEALEQILEHSRGGKLASGSVARTAASGSHVHASEGVKSKSARRGTNRGR